MAASTQIVFKLYKTVIDDVINNVREAFLDEGVEEPVLQDLKQIWETKLLQSRAVDATPPPQSSLQAAGKYGGESSHQSSRQSASERRQQQQQQQQHQQRNQSSLEAQRASTTQPRVASNLTHSATAAALALQHDAIQLQSSQISLPYTLQQQGSAPSTTQAFPAYQIQSQQPGGILGYQSIPVLIQQGGAQSNGQQSRIVTAGGLQVSTPQGIVIPTTGAVHVQSSGDQPSIVQVDGANDTSDEEEDDFDEDDDDDKDDDDDDNENENDDDAGDEEEEPLNSADDVSDEDPAELFEADNVVVCQYEKINRSRNKWKFNLKHGIMNLKGKDYVFCKSTGDADW